MLVHITPRNTSSGSYDIQIGTKLESAFSEIVARYQRESTFLVTDTNVYKNYSKVVLKYFPKRQQVLIIPSGEKSKNRKLKETLENKLLFDRVSRDSLIISFGGGVVGDLSGYLAATLLRGIPFIQIPTTLLSQVDSSIGGKVGINHPLGKNLIGTFYNPKKVYIDLRTLNTLSEKEFRNGIAEVIKYAAILDKHIFEYLQNNYKKIRERNLSTMAWIVQRCCELKKCIVEKDEREIGLRRILNFGHTIGHSIELLSKFRLSHGEAISIGMVAEAKISVLTGLLSDQDFEQLINLVTLFKLPTQFPRHLSLKRIVNRTLNDKKMKSGEVHYTLLRKIGKAVTGIPLSEKNVLNMLSA